MERNLHLLIVFCLWQNWERKFCKKQNLKRIYVEGILRCIFPLRAWRRKTKVLVDNIFKMHPTIKFTADSSKKSMNFLDVTVSIAKGIIETSISPVAFLPKGYTT